MTSQEARDQLNICEDKIDGAYKKLRGSARRMGASAAEVASSKTAVNTFMPLLISLAGVLLMMLSHPIWGSFLIIAGFFIAKGSRKSAQTAQRVIENNVQILNNTLDNYSKI